MNAHFCDHQHYPPSSKFLVSLEAHDSMTNMLCLPRSRSDTEFQHILSLHHNQHPDQNDHNDSRLELFDHELAQNTIYILFGNQNKSSAELTAWLTSHSETPITSSGGKDYMAILISPNEYKRLLTSTNFIFYFPFSSWRILTSMRNMSMPSMLSKMICHPGGHSKAYGFITIQY